MLSVSLVVFIFLWVNRGDIFLRKFLKLLENFDDGSNNFVEGLWRFFLFSFFVVLLFIRNKFILSVEVEEKIKFLVLRLIVFFGGFDILRLKDVYFSFVGFDLILLGFVVVE